MAGSRWRPPPGWPPPPPGFFPVQGWRPEPAWPPPPPGWVWWESEPRSRREKALLVLGAGAGGLAMAGLFVGFVYAMGSSHEELFPTLDGPVAERADAACRALRDGVDRLPRDFDRPSVLARLDGEVLLIDALVETMNGLGRQALADDFPAQAWVDDWADVARARADYAAQFRTGAAFPVMVEPSEDGVGVSERMKDAAPPACAVVDRLVAPVR